MSERFSVFGGGLSGPLMAAYLGRAGREVNLYELRPDPRRTDAGGGRSINLALSLRGLHALEEVGLAEKVKELALPMRGRMMHGVTGAKVFQPYGTEPDHYLNSISRDQLNQALLDAAAACPGVALHFEHKLQDLDWGSGNAEILDIARNEVRTVPAGTAIGADGAHSRLRASMQRGTYLSLSQDYLEYGYKELTMPPGKDGGFALEPDALHIWPRHKFMLIALPNLDRTFTCTLFWPFERFAAVRTEQDVLDLFAREFPDALLLLPDLPREFPANPVGPLMTVRCRPWRVGGRAVLIGDACHAVVPFYGQGMNAAFEDCTVLHECLRDGGSDREGAFARYEARRREHTDALADLALENFVVMRDRVASRGFLLRLAAGRALHRAFPRWYVPLYTMVSFTRMPYGEARDRARRQDRIAAAAAVAAVLALVLVLVLLLV